MSSLLRYSFHISHFTKALFSNICGWKHQYKKLYFLSQFRKSVITLDLETCAPMCLKNCSHFFVILQIYQHFLHGGIPFIDVTGEWFHQSRKYAQVKQIIKANVHFFLLTFQVFNVNKQIIVSDIFDGQVIKISSAQSLLIELQLVD